MAQAKSKKSSSSRRVILGSILILLLVVFVIVLLSSVGVLNIKMEKPGSGVITVPTRVIGPTPTPTPTELLQGKETYSIGQWSGAKGPGIPTLSLDPHDPKVNAKQTLLVHIQYDKAVTQASIEFISDHKTRTLPLTLSSGTNTNGDWQAVWTVDDTVLYKYILTISATAGGVTNKVTVAPRS